MKAERFDIDHCLLTKHSSSRATRGERENKVEISYESKCKKLSLTLFPFEFDFSNSSSSSLFKLEFTRLQSEWKIHFPLVASGRSSGNLSNSSGASFQSGNYLNCNQPLYTASFVFQRTRSAQQRQSEKNSTQNSLRFFFLPLALSTFRRKNYFRSVRGMLKA